MSLHVRRVPTNLEYLQIYLLVLIIESFCNLLLLKLLLNFFEFSKSEKLLLNFMVKKIVKTAFLVIVFTKSRRTFTKFISQSNLFQKEQDVSAIKKGDE